MIRILVVLTLIWPVAISAQPSKKAAEVLVLDDNYRFISSTLDKAVSVDTLWEWHSTEYEVKDVVISEFNLLVHNIKRKTHFEQIYLSDILCTQFATLAYRKTNYHIEIYEIGFDYEYQCKKLLKSVKKHKVDSWSFRDGSLPIMFYSIGTSVFVFVDANDEFDDALFKETVDDFKIILNAVHQ